jgi:siroheme synthase
LFAASTPGARQWIGTLSGLARSSEQGELEIPDGPGTIVIGEVVALAHQLGHATTCDDADRASSAKVSGLSRP